MLVLEIIKAAYANLGVTDLEEGPTPAQYEQGLKALNSMLGAWSSGHITLYGLFEESFTLVSGDNTYSVGTGQDFNTAWPYEIKDAFIRDSNNVDYIVEIITPGEYIRISDKTTQSRPYQLAYNPKGYPIGNVNLYPTPDAAYTLHWTAQKLITSYTSIHNTLGIAPEYEEAIEYNLTIRLAPKCRVPITRELFELARSSKAILPIVVEPAIFDGIFESTTEYNIYSGC